MNFEGMSRSDVGSIRSDTSILKVMSSDPVGLSFLPWTILRWNSKLFYPHFKSKISQEQKRLSSFHDNWLIRGPGNGISYYFILLRFCFFSIQLWSGWSCWGVLTGDPSCWSTCRLSRLQRTRWSFLQLSVCGKSAKLEIASWQEMTNPYRPTLKTWPRISSCMSALEFIYTWTN